MGKFKNKIEITILFENIVDQQLLANVLEELHSYLWENESNLVVDGMHEVLIWIYFDSYSSFIEQFSAFFEKYETFYGEKYGQGVAYSLHKMQQFDYKKGKNIETFFFPLKDKAIRNSFH